ncbi:MAG: HAMP domain-containing sensor histidine kinase [Actinomycetota bacterium]|nr:HAMP domain-containing sensor histidine kinase [Actinomycetota bacterium]
MTRRIAIGTALIALVMVIVGLAVFSYVDRAVREQAQDELFRQAEATGVLVEAELATVDITPGARIETQLRKVRTEAARTLERARVVGGHDMVEGALLVGSRSFPLSLRQDLMPLLPPDLAEREVLSLDVDGTEMFATVQRIPLANSEIVIAIGRTAPLLPIREMNRALLFTVAVGVALIAVFGVAMAGWVGRRLSGLESASRAIAAGDLTARAPVEGDDEITEASVAFNDMAEQLQATRLREREFLLSIGHDLRTPLTTIRGYAEALNDGLVNADDAGRVAEVLHMSTDRLSRLVEDIMLLARLEAREFTLQSEEVEVGAYVAGIVEAHRVRAMESGIDIDLDVSDNGVADIDPDRFGQVCSNLIENAMRYTPEHGRVIVSIGCSDGAVHLTVADAGPGIDPEDIDRVFDRLFVAQHYRPIRPEGSGLGLTIVQGLVEAMGGAIEVRSTPGAGTKFSVEIPT